MNDRRERVLNKVPLHGHARPAAPPPPPPSSAKTFMGGSTNNLSGGSDGGSGGGCGGSSGNEKKMMQRESRNAYATVALMGTAAPSCSEVVTGDAYRTGGGQQAQSLRGRPGVNNRTVAAATGHCNGNSVPVQPQARLNPTYEVYHIHRQPNSRSSQPQARAAESLGNL